MITVTRASVPSFEEFLALARGVFEARHFTNHGPLVNRFEVFLKNWLTSKAVPQPHPNFYVTSCNNGTSALILALRALGVEGKRVITTPFTYVATLSALLAAGCEPVFVDVDPETLCLTPEAAEQVLDSDVGGVLPVHIYGNACDVAGFSTLSQKYRIPVIYDAAHAFGAQYSGQSLLAFGDCAAGSFHATKVLHTCEGGCVVSHSEAVQNELTLMRAFGHVGDTHVMSGINAKMSELHAAMGLCLLPHVQDGIAARKTLSEYYDTLLAGLPVQYPAWRAGLQRNYAYYPVIFESEKALLAVQTALHAQSIAPRRYFYPALNTLPYLKDEWKRTCPVAESVSHRVLCLPLYAELTHAQAHAIVTALKNSL